MRYKVQIAFVLLAALFASCNEEPVSPQPKPAAPKFEFSITEETFAVEVDSAVVFTATQLEGTQVKAEWSVDGVKVAGTPSVTWKFTKLGVSTVHFEASNDLGKVEKDYTVTVNGVPLEVTYSVPEEAFDAVIGTAVEVSVTVTRGDKETIHSWTLDGTVVGSDASVSLVFDESQIGAHTLAYSGVNCDGMTASKTWTVNVIDLPLEIAYTPAGDAVEAMEGDEVAFKATVVHGATGISYSWKVNGTEVATTAGYTHTCSAQGSFTIAFSATNGIGEKAEKSWTLTVVEKTERNLMFDDFESSATGESSYYVGNNVGGVSILQVVENPYKTSANSSSKVLVDKGSMMSSTSSGYFKFKVNTKPDGVTAISYDERKIYTKFRCKVYLGTTGFTPLLQSDITGNPRSAPALINGIPFNPQSPVLADWNAAIKTNDWNELVYDFSNAKYGDSMNHLGNTEQLQFRVFVDFNNNGKAGADVYFDDFEFVE